LNPHSALFKQTVKEFFYDKYLGLFSGVIGNWGGGLISNCMGEFLEG